MINLDSYRMFMEKFCVVIESIEPTPIVISIPHDSLPTQNFNNFFLPRKSEGRDLNIWPIVRDIMLDYPTHMVRGLMPRRFIEYNTGYPINTNYYPLSGKEKIAALADQRLIAQYQYFHDTIKRLIAESKKAFSLKECLLVDMHGFGNQPEYAPPVHGFDLILGTGNRSTIKHGNIDKHLAKYFSDLGYNIFLPQETNVREIEDAFNGGYIVRHHSKESNINAIQIEIAPRFRNRDGKDIGQKLAKHFTTFFSSIS